MFYYLFTFKAMTYIEEKTILNQQNKKNREKHVQNWLLKSTKKTDPQMFKRDALFFSKPPCKVHN
jgi:hypothetical protein